MRYGHFYVQRLLAFQIQISKIKKEPYLAQFCSKCKNKITSFSLTLKIEEKIVVLLFSCNQQLKEWLWHSVSSSVRSCSFWIFMFLCTLMHNMISKLRSDCRESSDAWFSTQNMIKHVNQDFSMWSICSKNTLHIYGRMWSMIRCKICEAWVACYASEACDAWFNKYGNLEHDFRISRMWSIWCMCNIWSTITMRSIMTMQRKMTMHCMLTELCEA